MNADERNLLEGLQELASEGPRQRRCLWNSGSWPSFESAPGSGARIWMSAAGAGAMAAAIAVLVWIGPLRPVPGALQQDSVVQADETAADFYPLPDADGLPPVESAMVVRVQLPMSSLELIGFPVNQDRDSDPVEAEVLLGQDGLARGVRLVE